MNGTVICILCPSLEARDIHVLIGSYEKIDKKKVKDNKCRVTICRVSELRSIRLMILAAFF